MKNPLANRTGWNLKHALRVISTGLLAAVVGGACNEMRSPTAPTDVRPAANSVRATPLSGSRSRRRAVMPPSAAAPAFSSLAGSWKGTWTDTRYNVSGPLSATFTVNGTAVTTTGTIGLSSLGLGNESGTGSGTISGQTLNFTFGAATVGNGSGTLSASGPGSGTGTVTGALNFGAFTFSGHVSGTTISGNFNFTSPTGGLGTATLTKQ